MNGDHSEVSRAEKRPVIIRTPAELIASVPSILGFPPGEGSVVVVCGPASDGGQGPVVRLDVDDSGGPGLHGSAGSGLLVARGVGRFCAREGIDVVHLVVVGPDSGQGDDGLTWAERVGAEFDWCLGAVGVEVVGAYGVGEFREGVPWVDLHGGEGGLQVHPDSTQIAAVHAFGGRVRAESREEIDNLYRCRAAPWSRVRPWIGDRAGAGGAEIGRVEVDGAVRRHDAAARRLGAGERVDDDDLARIGLDLTEISVRDEVYRQLAVEILSDSDGRRDLWWMIARRCADRERSVALLLLGAAAYFAGDGVHAWSACVAALEADSANSLARLLLEGLRSGLAPGQIRDIAAAA